MIDVSSFSYTPSYLFYYTKDGKKKKVISILDATHVMVFDRQTGLLIRMTIGQFQRYIYERMYQELTQELWEQYLEEEKRYFEEMEKKKHAEEYNCNIPANNSNQMDNTNDNINNPIFSL